MSSVFTPRVSIVIPVYNGANYLREAVESALSQTYPNLEIIVVNDGSCDDGETERIALSYGDKIRYFCKENGGVSSALNLGIRNMTGDYFSWLSHDDKYEPGKVENSVRYLASFENREKLIALCGGYYINGASEKIRDMNMNLQRNVVYTGAEVNLHILRHGVLDACCLLIPKTAFEISGYFHEGLRYNQDALLWHQMFSCGYQLVADPEQRDVMYRLHKNQTSKIRRDLLLHDSLEMAKIIAPVFAMQSTGKNNLLFLYAKRNARQHCVDAVNACIRVGKQTETMTFMHIGGLKGWLFWGRIRNVAKRLYHRLVFT